MITEFTNLSESTQSFEVEISADELAEARSQWRAPEAPEPMASEPAAADEKVAS